MEIIDPTDSGEANARTLEEAAAILRAKFGRLTAGDLITGLEGAAASIRSRGGIIRPVPEERERAIAAERGDQIHARLRSAGIVILPDGSLRPSDWEHLLGLAGL